MKNNKNLCTHRNSGITKLEEISNGMVKCEICGAEFKLVNNFEYDANIIELMSFPITDNNNVIYNTLQTIKSIYIDADKIIINRVAGLLEKDKYSRTDLMLINKLFDDANRDFKLYEDKVKFKSTPLELKRSGMKVKIITNDTYNFEGKESSIDYTGCIITNMYNDLSKIYYCETINELNKILKSEEFITFLEDDTETPVIYNKSMIRSIVPIHAQIKR